MRRRSTDRLEGVFRPKLFFLELVQLQLLARREAHAAIERCDALGQLCMLFFKVRSSAIFRNGSSVVLGHVTSEVHTGLQSQANAGALGATRQY